MKINPDSKIKLECNNWYEIEGDILKVCMRNGHTILLKSSYRTVWLAIGYGLSFSEFKEKMEGIISPNIYMKIVNKFHELDLVTIIQPDDEFDVIFN